MLDAQLPDLDFQRVSGQRFRLVVEAQADVDVAYGAHQAGLHARLITELALDPVGAAVEDLAHGDRLAPRPARVRLLEEPDHEVEGLAGRFGFLRRQRLGSSCLSLGAPCSHHADRGAAGTEQQCDRRDRGGDDSDTVAARELPDPVARARRSSVHRLVRQMTPDVLGQARRGFVAPRPVFLHGLHGDPVQITPQSPLQRPHVRPAACSNVFCRLIEGHESRARRRRIVLSQYAPHLFPPCRPQHLRRDRQYADQQLVQQHAQRVNVGPRIHIEPGHLRLLGAHVDRRTDHHP